MKALAKEAKPQSAYAVLEGQFRQFAATLGFSVEAAAQRRGWASSCSGSIISQTYERKRSPHMVNIPRALFTGRTGLEPRYHVAIEELATGLSPLKGGNLPDESRTHNKNILA